MGRKRKNLHSPYQKMVVPPCRICEAPGAGLHYGVTTCEACKGFFHRSLRSHSGYKCKNNNSCSIQFHLRKICSQCRFEKCLSLGMSKTAIKTGRYTLDKKAKDIMEIKSLEAASKRKKGDREGDDIPARKDLSDEAEATIFDTYDPSISKRCRIEDQLLQGNQDYFIDYCLKNEEGRSPPSVNSFHSFSPSRRNEAQVMLPPATQSSESQRKPDVLVPDFCESPSGSPCFINNLGYVFLNENERGYTMSAVSPLAAVETRSESPNSTYCPRDSSVSSLSPQLLTHDLERADELRPSSQISTECFAQYHSPEVLHSKSFIPLQLSPSQISIEVLSDLNSDIDLHDLFSAQSSTSSSSQITQNVSPLYQLELSDSLGTNDGSRLTFVYEDMDSVVQILLEAERANLRSLASLDDETILEQQERHYEQCRLRTELFGRKTLLFDAEYQEVFKQTGLDADGRREFIGKKVNNIGKTIQGIAKFAKAIPGFTGIEFSQMVNLIKHSRRDIILLSASRLTHKETLVTYSPSCSWLCPLDFDETLANDFIIPTVQFLAKVNEINLTNEEMAVLKAIALMSPDRQEPTDSPLIRWIHSRLLDILLKLFKRRFQSPMPVFARIVGVLAELRTKEKEMSLFFKHFNLCKDVKSGLRDKPLLRQMMTGPFMELDDTDDSEYDIDSF